MLYITTSDPKNKLCNVSLLLFPFLTFVGLDIFKTMWHIITTLSNTDNSVLGFCHFHEKRQLTIFKW